ncbi:GerAB/ArcD/ProY family transporter [Alkalihalobacterium alkalinitrilicum]|uniref:GerAB/ArcD/ProY family transporter n=1 Tax=Alkalihalobacterium alkalinitrilicum TaxID=427920 RepID=UPI001EE468EB|nr:GerAB/ArcD/ProY family transporter [Alkalihalobacterium alkalinitrilicum]
MTFPFMEIVRMIEVPGGFFERLQSIALVIWIMALFTSTSLYQLLAVKIINDIFSPHQKVSWLSTAIVFISFIIAFLPENITELEKLGSSITYYGIGITFVPIGFGFLTVWMRKKTSPAMRSLD